MELIVKYILPAINVVTLLIYGFDKFKAKVGGWRIPESTLIVLGLIGGGIGGLIGMFIFRHKTKKNLFLISNLIGSVLFVYLFVTYVY